VGNFKRDLAISQQAVKLLMDHYVNSGYKVGPLEGKENQKKGDFWISTDGARTNIEVKFDMYAQRSGNLCFEMSNGKKETGIMTTLADEVCYVVPYEAGFNVFVFCPDELRTYIQDPSKVSIKSGGDKRKFILALAKITDIVEDKLPKQTFKLP